MSNNIENLFTQYYQILRAYALRYVTFKTKMRQKILYKTYSSNYGYGVTR